MKNKKINNLDKIIIERFILLNKLHKNTKWLIYSNMPVKQKLAIWHSDLEKFCYTLGMQDRRIRKLIKN